MYSYLISISSIVLNTCIPLLLMAIFAIQTLKDLHQRRVKPTNTRVTTMNNQQSKDRQFTILVLAEVAAYVLFVPWSSGFGVYLRMTQSMYKSASQQALEQFIVSIFSIPNYLTPAISFYQNCIVSKALHQRTKALFFGQCQRHPTGGSSRDVNVKIPGNQPNQP
ncbi:unnamed protein product [Adineta ricciae]|uniref:G-protein coupled receptors family 1 profile domain-containing protein n=1 Tax=Adineta ricciae TaxID=249248 RepID=A0A816EWS2_ADIRI|nr:unnamed protein product [Adineta ricciae]CAF1658711.1 unnamed protein product [Adineta ricciae]